jgi:uncharacterized protein YpmB
VPGVKKWILYSILGILVIFAGLYLFYYAIQKDRWDEENAAIRQAVANTPLTQAEKAEKFIGQKTYMIVYGQNEENQDTIVWVGDDEIHSELASAGVNKNQVKSFVMSRYDRPKVLRMTPGKLDQVWVWEVFYTLEVNNKERYFYDFYRFRDGEYLRSYRLSRN